MDTGSVPLGSPKTAVDREPEFLPKDAAYEARMKRYAEEGMKVDKEGEELQGERRVIVDGLLDGDGCKQLMELAEVTHLDYT